MSHKNDKTTHEFFIWEGILKDFPEEHSSESVWNSEQWMSSLAKKIHPKLQAYNAGRTVSMNTVIHEYPLPPVAALLTSMLTTPVRILDFGGGLGHDFLALIDSLPHPEQVEFHIVESDKVCQQGQALCRQFPNLFFHRELPDKIEQFDLVHAGSSLHYIADWRGMLRSFADFNPLLIMLSSLTAGDIETFVTYQNYYGSKIPVWFWNIHEMIEALNSVGYQLIYKSLLECPYLGTIQPLPMENFPEKYRLRQECNLLCISKEANLQRALDYHYFNEGTGLLCR